MNDIFYVYDIENFSEKKQEVLNGIALTGIHSVYEKDQRISNTDWYLTNMVDKEYLKPLSDDINAVFAGLRQRNICIPSLSPFLFNCWFQQYEQGDFHSWHIHTSAYSSVVFIELPAGVETEFFINGNVIKVPVKEGQILTFPSTFPHHSPVNTSEYRKTIVSLNIGINL